MSQDVAYLFINKIGIKRYKNLKKRYVETGIQMKEHGNAGKVPKFALTYEDSVRIVSFVKHYAVQHGLILPGRIPSFKSSDLILLPSNVTKREFHRQLTLACEESHHRPVGSFRRIWKMTMPNVVIQQPRTDLCTTCHANITSVSKLSGMSEEEKMEEL